MSRGQHYSRERWKQLGREGGIVSVMVRREKLLARYMEIAREKGIYEALVLCAAQSWKRGYDSRMKKEVKL